MQNQSEADGSTVTIRISMRLNRTGGRKVVIAPELDDELALKTGHPSTVLLKAVGRGFRWQRLLDEGRYSTIEEIAAAEKINESYVGRLLRLSMLAPDVILAILDGRANSPRLASLMKPFPADWDTQREMLPPGSWRAGRRLLKRDDTGPCGSSLREFRSEGAINHETKTCVPSQVLAPAEVRD